jgi:hypothetical protein
MLNYLLFPYQNSDKSQKTYARFLLSSLVFFSRKLMLHVLELSQGMSDAHLKIRWRNYSCFQMFIHPI